MFLLPKDSWEVKITSEKGKGIFTKRKIVKGTVIGDYLGLVIRTSEYNIDQDKAGLYLMYFSDNASLYPDLTKPGPHLFNHACKPNCWIYIYQGHTLFFALMDIEPGEELTISYLLSPNEGTCIDCVHFCKCRDVKCTGTMHISHDSYELWQAFQNKLRNKTKRRRITYGKQLPQLKKYPKKILPHNPIYAIIYAIISPN